MAKDKKENKAKEMASGKIGKPRRTVTGLDNAHQVHGAIQVQKPEDSVYALMGKNVFPYKEKTSAEYRQNLDGLSLSDLQKHAVEIANVIPNTMNRTILMDRLEREYLRKQFAFVDKRDVSVNAKLDSKSEKDIQDLLSRGK